MWLYPVKEYFISELITFVVYIHWLPYVLRTQLLLFKTTSKLTSFLTAKATSLYAFFLFFLSLSFSFFSPHTCLRRSCSYQDIWQWPCCLIRRAAGQKALFWNWYLLFFPLSPSNVHVRQMKTKLCYRQDAQQHQWTRIWSPLEDLPNTDWYIWAFFWSVNWFGLGHFDWHRPPRLHNLLWSRVHPLTDILWNLSAF